MPRTCSIAAVVWIALIGAYAYVLRDLLGMPKLAIVSFMMGNAVWIGLVWIFGTRHLLRDWRARNRTARGERPLDGDLTAVTGEIHPSFEPIRSPLSGRDCVIYTYDAGAARRAQGPTARVYVGFGMTRCAIRTPFGEYFLGSFPVLEGFGKESISPGTAMQQLQSAHFETANILALAKQMMKLHTEAPPLRRDFKLGDAAPQIGELESVEECVIEPGETVTAFGRYNSGISALVSDVKEKGFLRLQRGGQTMRAQAVPWSAIGSFVGGVAIVTVANAILWLALNVLRQ